jgi:hypothetical protein
MTDGQAIVLSFILALAVWAFSELFNFIVEKLEEWIGKKRTAYKEKKSAKQTITHE